MSTYVNIGTFLKNENTLIKFFALRKEDTPPFSLVIPNIPNAFSGENFWPLGSYSNWQPESLKFLQNDSTLKVIDQLTLEIWKVLMVFYFQKNQVPLNEVLEANWDKISLLIAPKKEKDFVNDKEIQFIDQLFQYFEMDDYLEFKNLMINFEDFVKIKCWPLGVLSNYHELLLCELMLKDVSRPFFLIEQEINEKTNHVEKDGTYTRYLVKQDQRYFNNSQLINLILYQNENKTYPLNVRLSHATHIDIQETNDEGFATNIVIHWIASNSKQIKSNVEKENILDSLIQFNLKDILRYSQNYIEYIVNLKYSSAHSSENNFWLTQLIENLTLAIPENFHSALLPGTKIIPLDSQKLIISENFKRLANSIKISKSYFNYCRYLHRLLDVENYPNNLYLDDFVFKIPLWEISRIQHLNLEKFFRMQSEQDLNEEQKNDNFWEPDPRRD